MCGAISIERYIKIILRGEKGKMDATFLSRFRHGHRGVALMALNGS